jgi:hypothetical protein
MSTATLSFEDLIEINKPQVAEFQRLAELFTDSSDSNASATFSKQARLVEGVLVQTYGIAAKLTRDIEDLPEIAEVWKDMADFCNLVLQTLSSLKAGLPCCGTSELYDLALDYKLACDKRYRGIQEELSCQKSEFPKGILPELN